MIVSLINKNLKIKNIMKSLIVLVLLLTTFSLTAQERSRPQKDHEGYEKMQMLEDLMPEEAATLRTKHMVLDLNLSEAQQKEVYALNLKNAVEHQSKRVEMKKKKEGEFDENPSKEDRYKFLNERLDNQIAQKKNMQRILNKEQFEKWERSSKRDQHKRKMRKHRSKRSR